MEILLIGVLCVAVAAAAFLIGRNTSRDARKIADMEQVLLDKDQQLDNYRQQVSAHFEKSAELFDRVSEDYQALYQHMAQTSQQLINTQPFSKGQLESENQTQALPTQSTAASVEEPADLADTFNNESLYRAHEYRNQDEVEKAEEPELAQSSDNIIPIESSKPGKQEESSQDKPLDYAVKEEGVVNHNSLDIENQNH